MTTVVSKTRLRWELITYNSFHSDKHVLNALIKGYV